MIKNDKEMETLDNDIKSMSRISLVEKYGSKVSDASLGAIMRRKTELYKQYLEDTAEERKIEGEKLKSLRTSLNIPRRVVAEGIGIHPATLNNYEKGNPVRSPKMLRESAITAIELINLKRNNELEKIRP